MPDVGVGPLRGVGPLLVRGGVAELEYHLSDPGLLPLVQERLQVLDEPRVAAAARAAPVLTRAGTGSADPPDLGAVKKTNTVRTFAVAAHRRSDLPNPPEHARTRTTTRTAARRSGSATSTAETATVSACKHSAPSCRLR